MGKAREGPTPLNLPLDGSWQWVSAQALPTAGGQVGKMWCHGMGLHCVGVWQITLLLPALGISGFQDRSLWFNFVSGKERGNLSCKCRDTTRSDLLCCVQDESA